MRGEQGEELVFETLKKDSNNKRIINNLVLLGKNDMSHQTDHIIVRYNGIFVIETKNYYGEISGTEKDSNWKRVINEGKKNEVDFFRNPLKQNRSHMKAVRRIVGDNYPIYGFICFVRNNVSNLGLFNVTGPNEINNRLNMITIDEVIPDNVLDELYNKLLYSEADVNQEAHLNNIKAVKEERIDFQKQARHAIETRKCPKCGNDLIPTKNGLKCNNCAYILKI